MYSDPSATRALSAAELETVGRKHEVLRIELTSSGELLNGPRLAHAAITGTIKIGRPSTDRRAARGRGHPPRRRLRDRLRGSERARRVSWTFRSPQSLRLIHDSNGRTRTRPLITRAHRAGPSILELQRLGEHAQRQVAGGLIIAAARDAPAGLIENFRVRVCEFPGCFSL